MVGNINLKGNYSRNRSVSQGEAEGLRATHSQVQKSRGHLASLMVKLLMVFVLTMVVLTALCPSNSWMVWKTQFA